MMHANVHLVRSPRISHSHTYHCTTSTTHNKQLCFVLMSHQSAPSHQLELNGIQMVYWSKLNNNIESTTHSISPTSSKLQFSEFTFVVISVFESALELLYICMMVSHHLHFIFHLAVSLFPPIRHVISRSIFCMYTCRFITASLNPTLQVAILPKLSGMSDSIAIFKTKDRMSADSRGLSNYYLNYHKASLIRNAKLDISIICVPPSAPHVVSLVAFTAA